VGEGKEEQRKKSSFLKKRSKKLLTYGTAISAMRPWRSLPSDWTVPKCGHAVLLRPAMRLACVSVLEHALQLA
jgi:hypothetical protein